jgi:tripartite motif-containing protein 71
MVGSPQARSPTSLRLDLTVGADRESVGIEINGLAVDNLGNIYLGEGSPGGRVYVYDAQGKPLTTWGEGPGRGEAQFDFITSLAIDGQGNMYVADFNNVRVQKFDRLGHFVAQWPTEQPAGPVGVGVDSAGNVFVLNHRQHMHYLQKFDSNGHPVLAWGGTGKGQGDFDAGPFSGPEGIAVDAAGHVYATDQNNARAQEFSADGKFLNSFGSAGFQGEDGRFFPGNGPGGVAVHDSGHVYATGGDIAAYGGTIQEFDASGRFIAKWDKTGADRLIALDGKGAVYVTDEHKRSVLKYHLP